jgi:hypothetical protein
MNSPQVSDDWSSGTVNTTASSTIKLGGGLAEALSRIIV